MTSARFARRARLQKPGDFEAAFERGSRFNEKHLAALVIANVQQTPRLGLAVAKKTVAQASGRNRIKRQVRESFRQNQNRLPGVDIVILSRPGCAKARLPELRATLDRLWNRIAASCASSSSS